MRFRRQVCSAAVASLLSVTIARAQSPATSVTPPPLVPPNLLAGTPFQLDEMSKESLSEIEGSPLVLREAVATALATSPEIREQLLGPVVSDAELEARKGVYALSFFADLSGEHQVLPEASALAGTSSTDAKLLQFGGGLEQPIPVGGGQVTLGLENQIVETNSSYVSLSPEYVPVLSLELKQPLLKNLLIDQSRAQIRLAELERTRSSLTLAQTVRDVTRTVEGDYWELYFAMQQVRINRLALELGKTLLGNDRRRFEVGVLPRPDLLDDEASVANLDDELVRTRSVLRAASDQLRRDLGLGLAGPGLLAADLPEGVTLPTEPVDAIVAKALASREELARASAEVEQRGVDSELAENQRLPSIDLTADAKLDGISGSGRAVDFGGVTLDSPFVGDFGDSYHQLVSGDFYDLFAGVRITIPLTSSEADHEAQVAHLKGKTAERTLERLKRDVDLEVRRAHDNLTTAVARIGTSGVALDRARENLESEAKRYSLGASRTDDVIRKIESYARALGTFNRAQADARIAGAQLDRVSANNLERLGITVPKSSDSKRPSPEDVIRGTAEAPAPHMAPH